jgi:hypothetical protein
MKKTLIMDVNDILFSTQYIFLDNINNALLDENEGTVRENFRIIKQNIMQKDKSFFQSIVHRELEEIVSPEEFLEIMKFAEYREKIKEGIRIHTPYSRYMMNMNKLLIETNIIAVYDNEIEEFLIKNKTEDLDKESFKIMSTGEMHTHLEGNINRDDVALFTSKTSHILFYNEKLDIMIPDTLMYLKKYEDLPNIYPVKGLWTHIK